MYRALVQFILRSILEAIRVLIHLVTLYHVSWHSTTLGGRLRQCTTEHFLILILHKAVFPFIHVR